MTVDILICTIDDGISGVESCLMPPMPAVHYIISMQHTRQLAEQSEWTAALDRLRQRHDVTVATLDGRGLSRNRNNALRLATADVVILSDDDCRYTAQRIANITQAYGERPAASIICFEAESYDGIPLKQYPAKAMSYAEACREGYYPASVEITFRRADIASRQLQFDERFGLGSQYPASEEEVLLCDAERAGLRIDFVPMTIVQTDPATTGMRFLSDHRLQTTKGAVFRYRYGLCSALWRTLKEGAHHFLHHGANPFSIYYHMLRGLWK